MKPDADKESATERADMEALEWQVVFWSGETTKEDEQAFAHWLASDPGHLEAWQRIQIVDRRINAMPESIAADVVRAGLLQPSVNRRTILRGFSLLAGGSLAAYAVSSTPQWSRLSADHGTAAGERRESILPDGTHIALNSGTAVDIRFTAQERIILMRDGEILISSAKDDRHPPRPLIVQTDEGRVQAIGTQFLVRRLEAASAARISVQVFDGTVRITPASAIDSQDLQAGQQTRFDRDGIQPPAPANPHAAAWQRGLLVAEHMKLSDFLSELGRHRAGVLRCDSAVANLVVSGVYPLEDTDRVLAALPPILPVSIKRRTRLWVTVGPS